MALPIKQGATHKVVIGPFVDVTDGFTPETGITLSGADEAEVILHDNATVVDISLYTWAAITTADGYYHLTLQSGITNNVGHMTVVIQDDSICLPVKADFVILDTGIYDSIYADGAASLATEAKQDIIDTNVDDIETAVITNAAGVDIAADIIALKAETVLILADTDDIGVAGAGLTDLGGMSTGMKAEINTEVDSALKDHGLVLHRAAIGTVNSQTEFVIPATDDAVDDDAYNDCIAIIIDQTDPNQVSVRLITDYVASTRAVTISSAADFTVVASDILCILPATQVALKTATQTSIDAIETDTNSLNDTKIPDTISLANINVEADTALTDYDPPTRAEATSDKDEIVTDLDDVKGTGFVKDTHSLVDIEAYVDVLDDGTSGNAKIATDVAAILVDTGTTLQGELDGIQADTEDLQTQIGTAGAGLTDLGGMSTGMKAEVNTEVDTALTDYDSPTRSELTTDINSILNILQGLVLEQGTIGATGNSTTALHLDGLTYGDNEIKDYNIVIFDVSLSEYHVRLITGWTLSTEIATFATLDFTPQASTDTYWLLPANHLLAATQASIDAIESDTNELQSDDYPTSIAAVQTTVDAIEVDTGTTLQGELDGIQADTENIQSRIPSALVSGRMDSDIGAKTGNVALSAQEKLDVNTEADSALTDYDPPTRTELTSDKDEIITDLDDIKGTGFVKDTHSLVDIESYVDLIDDGTSGLAKIAIDVAAVLVDTATTLQAELDGIQADTEDIQTRLPAVLVGGRMDSDIGATTGTMTATPQGAPGTTPTVYEALMVLYDALIHKVDITATLKEFHNDGGTVIWKKTLSDDGTTYSEAESATGP